MRFWRNISVYIPEDKFFRSFVEESFRYNELRNFNKFSQKGQSSKIKDIQSRSEFSKNDLVSVRTNLQPNNILLLLEEILSKKNNKGYINFFKSLKGNDYDRDGFLYFKEW